MLRKTIIASVAVAGLAIATPASADGWNGGSTSTSGEFGRYKHQPERDKIRPSNKPDQPSRSPGGTKVPEPGMLGIAGLGLIGLGLIRRRRARKNRIIPL